MIGFPPITAHNFGSITIAVAASQALQSYHHEARAGRKIATSIATVPVGFNTSI